MCLILITKIIVVVLNKNGEYMENTNPIQALKDRIIAWEHNAGELRTKIAPVLMQKNNVCGEASLNDREDASPLNEQLLSILSRLNSHDVFLLNTTEQVTL